VSNAEVQPNQKSPFLAFVERLKRHGGSMGNGIKSILAVIAALLLPAGLAVLRNARREISAPDELPGSPPATGERGSVLTRRGRAKEKGPHTV
jgi:hypothetical protein